MEKTYNKLVRDKIPEIIKNNGGIPKVRILDNEEYRKELHKKLLEEYNEVLCAINSNNYVEELADMLEVIKSIAEIEGVSLERIIEIAKEKSKKRGSFKEKIYLEKVIED